MKKILTQNKFLKLFTEIELNILEQFWLQKKYRQNDIILKQGQQGEGLFLIAQGDVKVISDFPGNEKYIFGQLKPGDFFGEVSLLDDGPVTASVIASKDTICLFLARDILTSLRLTLPELAHKLIVAITSYSLERLRAMFASLPELLKKVKPEYRNAFSKKTYQILNETKILKLTNKINLPQNKDLQIFVPFQEFSVEEIEILRNYLSIIIVKENTLLYEYHDTATFLYFIIEGSAQLAYKAEDMQIKLDVKGPGSFLSILPYFDNKEEGLSCIVREYAKLLIISYNDLEKIKNNHINIYYKLYHHLAIAIVTLLRDVNKQLLRIKCELEISII